MSSARQGITVFGKKNQWIEEDSDLLILVEKTGYYNFWINGVHYYYDGRQDKSKIRNAISVFAFNGGKKEEEKKKKKGKITITKK